MGRTVEELLYGSDSFRPISSIELLEWQALWKLRAVEAEQQAKRNGR